MIEIENLTKIFKKGEKNEVIAVNNASFTVNDGEVFGLLGPNGAGKTTTLRMISTILKPTSGTAMIEGYNVTKEPDKVRKSVGFLTGETKLYDRLTARETLFYFGRLYNIPDGKIKGRIEEIASMLELKDALNKRVSTLSDGMKQKVSIGRAIIHNPKVLVLDEPLTGLDILARRAITDFIKSSKEQEKSIIFSTHVMTEAEEMCDRVAIIYKGKILDIGKKDELKERYGKTTLEEIFIALMRREDEKN
ncbi:ATP-binding cassette domain-containing protein [candidate division WOR-3 bacterium]|nr:ATP-binding cassette domain-containing protein [candidate division WOR-3 bacterium]